MSDSFFFGCGVVYIRRKTRDNIKTRAITGPADSVLLYTFFRFRNILSSKKILFKFCPFTSYRFSKRLPARDPSFDVVPMPFTRCFRTSCDGFRFKMSLHQTSSSYLRCIVFEKLRRFHDGLHAFFNQKISIEKLTLFFFELCSFTSYPFSKHSLITDLSFDVFPMPSSKQL